MKLEFIIGDVFKMRGDALVFPANPKPVIGGSLDGAVFERAGKELLLPLREEIGALEGGKVCLTDSCRMKTNYTYLIHAVTPFFDQTDSFNKLKGCYLSAFETAENYKLKTLVCALLGAGARAFPHEKAKEAAENAVKQYAIENPESVIENVTVVEYENESQYQLLIKCNQKLKELKALLDKIDDLKDSVQIDSCMGDLRLAVAEHLKTYADRELAQIKQAYDYELKMFAENDSPIPPEDQLYKSIVRLPENMTQSEFAERIYVGDSSDISHIMNLYSKNGIRHKSAEVFLKSKNNVLKLGLGLELSFDKMCRLMWCRGHEFPITDFDKDICESYIKQGDSLYALQDLEKDFNKRRGDSLKNKKTEKNIEK